MREIITLQFGPFANFVGAHFWNFQDEALGRMADQSSPVADLETQTFLRRSAPSSHSSEALVTPRLVAVDLKGCLGPLSLGTPGTSSHQHQGTPALTTWQGSSIVHKAPAARKGRFLEALSAEEAEQGQNRSVADAPTTFGGYEPGSSHATNACRASEPGSLPPDEDEIAEDLENGGVGYWTQYSKAYLHPRSVVQTSTGWWQGVGGGEEVVRPYWEGADLAPPDVMESIEDNVRYFAEECDQLQGFNIISNDYDAFAQIMGAASTTLSEDYPKLPRVLFSVRPPETVLGQWRAPGTPGLASSSQQEPVLGSRARNFLHVSQALSLSSAVSLSSLCAPMVRQSLQGALPWVHLKDSSLFHTSAVYAAALDTLLVPCATSSLSKGTIGGGLLLDDIVSLLTRQGKLASAELALPAVPAHRNPGASSSEPQGSVLSGLASLCPGLAVPGDSMARTVAQLAVIRGALSSASSSSSGPSIAAPPSTARACLEGSLIKERSATGVPMVAHLVASSAPLCLPLPFPRFFSKRIASNGAILPDAVASVPFGSFGVSAHGRERANKLQAAMVHLGTASGKFGPMGTDTRSIASATFGPDVTSIPVLARLTTFEGPHPMVGSALDVLRSAKKGSKGGFSSLFLQGEMEAAEFIEAIEALEGLETTDE